MAKSHSHSEFLSANSNSEEKEFVQNHTLLLSSYKSQFINKNNFKKEYFVNNIDGSIITTEKMTDESIITILKNYKKEKTNEIYNLLKKRNFRLKIGYVSSNIKSKAIM